MARTIAQIQAQITAFYVTAMSAIGITIDTSQWSRRNKQQLAFNAFATATAVLEQNFDAFVADAENIISSASPQTAPWIQNLCLNVFQYDATDPQIIQLDTAGETFAPYYEKDANGKFVFKPELRIVTQCVVVPGVFGTTSVKVAKAGPVALNSSEKAALQSLVDTLTIPGIIINVSSTASDKIFVGATVTYNGQYDSIINVANGTVVQAIQSFFASIPASGIVNPGFPSVVGVMKLTDLIATIKAVPGVVDVQLNNINARANGTSFTAGSNNLVQANTELLPQWNSGLSGAGYMVGETTTGYTLNDSITYVAV